MADDYTRAAADYSADPTAPVIPRVRDSVSQALDTKPDMAADLGRAARATGVPLAAAQGDADYVRKQATIQGMDLDNLTVTNPRTSTWLTTPQNAAVSHDDLDPLKTIERMGQNTWGLTKAGILGMGANLLGVTSAVNDALDPSGALGIGPGSNSSAYATYQRKRLQAAALSATPQTDSWWQAGVNSGVLSLVQNAPATLLSLVTGQPELALGVMGANTGGGGYNDARDAGLSPDRALAHGIAQGGVEVLTEKLPMEALLKDLKAGSGIAKTWLHQVATDLPGELTATMMQDFNDWADLHPGKPIMDYITSRPEALGETVIATLMGNTAHTALEQVTHAASKASGQMVPEQQRAQAAEDQHGRVAEIMAAAEASKLRERDPQTFEDFVKHATQDTPVEHVYIDADKLVDALGQGSPEKFAENADVLAAMPSVGPQLDQALQTGGTVEIPTSEFATYAAGTPLAQSLLEHLKTDPSQMSMAEAKEFMQSDASGQLEAEVKKVMAEQKAGQDLAASGERVKQNVVGQLQTANRFTPDVNEAYGALTSSFYETQAQRLGMTPEELFKAHPLNVAAQGVTEGSFSDQPLTQPAAKFDLSNPDVNTGGNGRYARETTVGPGTTLSYSYHAGTASDAPYVTVDMLHTEKRDRGQGYAKTAMQQLVQQADAEGVRLALTAEPMDKKTSKAKLEAFYKSLGFVKNKDPYVSAGMVREPQSLEQSGRGSGPTASALKAMLAKSGQNELRGLLDTEGNLHVWDAAEATHGDMAPKLGIPYDVGQNDNRAWVTESDGLPVIQLAEGARPPAAYLRSDKVLFEVPGQGLLTGREYAEHLGEDLAQATPAGPRGTFSPASNLIVLLRNADLSTFLHESGHFYLETLARIASDESAPQEIKDDWKTVAGWMGHNDADPATWLAMPVDDRREGHEKFARGFEAYLMTGKAPSQALQPLFQRFKSWLVNLYQKVASLNVQLTPEVRGVMDRLLASQHEIAQAEYTRRMAPVFDTKPDSMTDPEWQAYQRLGADATAEAQDQLQTRSIRDMQWLSNSRDRAIKALQADAREARKAVRAEVEAEVMAEPVYAAREFLKRGTVPEGFEWEGSHKLKISDVEAIYEGTPDELQDWRKLGYGKYGMLAADGVNPDHVAEQFGFSSGDHLIESLLNAPDPSEKIEGLTDQRMLERHGDLSDADSIKEAADRAVHNDARLRFVATEANALAKAAGKRKILAEAARNYAAQLIGAKRIRDLKPGVYTSAEVRAANNAAKLAAQGKLEEAAMAKRNQLINGYAAKAVYGAQEEVDKALRLFARLDSPNVRKTIDPDYRDQIDQMLERFDLRKGESLKAIDKRKSLIDWVERQRDRGFEPLIDPDLLNEANRKHYRDMTVEELRGLVDAVRNILHLGKLKNRLLMAAQQRAFDAVRDEMVQTVQENAYKTNAAEREFNTVAHGLKSGFLSVLAIHRKLPSLLREMGGNKDRTILWDAITRPMNERFDWEATRNEQATHALHALFDPLVKEGRLKQKTYIPEIGDSLSLEGRLAVALNWGNELNRARIMDGEKWEPPQVDAILKTLSPAHLKFVNDTWEYLDSFWPEIAAKQKRVTGVEPEKVEPSAFQATASDGSVVEMRGGYYPIKYETKRSDRSDADEKAQTLMATKQGLYTASQTRRGHTKARVEKVERPVRYDLMVPFQHVQQVNHDLAFHEFLIDANRLIGSRDFEMAVRAHYSPEVLATLKDTLNAIAVGDVQNQTGLDRAVNYVRTGTTITGLGFNLMTSLLQPLGLTQSVVRVGPKWMARAVGRSLTDAVTLNNTMGEIAAKSDFMRLRTTTFMREVNEVSNKVKASWKPTAWGPVEQSFFWMIGKLQLVADVPTWLGSYDKHIAGGETEETAIKLADQAVRDSQGSGYMGDLAQIQRGNVWFKLWTTFYSFFSVAHNQIAESVSDVRRDPMKLGKLASDVFLIAFLPTVLGEAIKRSVRGDDWDGFLGDAIKQELGFLLGMFVGLRELGSVLQSDGKQPASPGGLRILSDGGHLYGDVVQGHNTGTLPGRTRQDAVNTASILLHLPGAQINRTLDGLQALATGQTHNPMAIAFGKPHKAQ